MSSVLFLSPHLDDAVFSCGATIARLLESGDEVNVLTLFTGSVARPTGFALECQTSKGIVPEEDYMALRLHEDAEALRILGVELVRASHWPFLEAPHRGYNSAPELFMGERQGDDVWRQLAEPLGDADYFDLVFCPQGLGNHVDHLQTIRAALAVYAPEKLRFYRDTPYAIRQSEAKPSLLLPPDLKEECIVFDETTLERKIKGCAAYESQIGFQFGGGDEMARKLRSFHAEEARTGGQTPFAERFLTASKKVSD